MAYRLRMRNTSGPERGGWATLVRRMRTAAGLSGAETARRLNVDRATIWRWESGKQKPESLSLVQAFADLFGVDLDDALAAAGMRPAVPSEGPARTEPGDPDVDRMREIFEDPLVSQATKDHIRSVLRSMAELADSQPRPPRRRKAAS